MSMKPEIASVDVKICYVTESDKIQQYLFENCFYISLTQETFAHFILRSKKDPIYQNFIERSQKHNDAVKETFNVIDDIRKRSPKDGLIVGINNADEWINLQLKALKLEIDSLQLHREKVENGIRILREMKNDYREMGKLSS